MTSKEQSLQEKYAPKNICFGCGPSNSKGLRIRSFVEDDEIVLDFTPWPEHEAFNGVLNGGIIGILMDCHSNWAAAYFLMVASGEDAPPCTVTAEYHVKFRRPTPSDKPLKIRAKSAKIEGSKCTVEASLESDGKVTSTCTGTFVAVKPGHPAYHRW